LGAFISQVAPMAQQEPEAGPYLMRIMQWAVSKFRVSTEIESVLDQAVDSMKKKLAQPKSPPQPDPDTIIKAQIEQAKIASNEKIASFEVQSEQQVAALKATVELQKIEMQARFDNMQKQYEQISNLMTSLPSANQVIELDGIKQMVAQNKVDTDAQLSQVMQAVSRKRKRIPIRDQMGDIIEVREVDDEDNVLPPGVVSGPPGAPVMN
jgi:hypothetical protein